VSGYFGYCTILKKISKIEKHTENWKINKRQNLIFYFHSLKFLLKIALKFVTSKKVFLLQYTVTLILIFFDYKRNEENIMFLIFVGPLFLFSVINYSKKKTN
jgi:hypothetical protein